jgi:CheY-like chemotaxis protein
MHGTISVTSKEGEGSVFTVRLPLKPQASTLADSDLACLQGVPILVVGTLAASCAGIAAALTRLGMHPETVVWEGDGMQVDACIRAANPTHTPYQICLLDWQVPDKACLLPIQHIRQAAGMQMPILLTTACDWESIEPDARKAGVTAFVAKPLFPSDLVRCLTDALHAVPAAAPDASSAAPAPKHAPIMEGQRILLVEDNTLNREIAAEILEDAGLQVEEATDGSLAVQMLQEKGAGYYQLVLMDIQMPVMDGYTATKTIRAFSDPQLAHIPIVAMTANAFAEDKQRAIESGMNAHVAKPISVDALLETLRQILSQ